MSFKLGDKVWDAIHYPGKEGKVHDIREIYMSIKFNGKASEYFHDGRIAMTGQIPTLSKVPYEFKLPEQPHEFQKGDPVLVRDWNTEEWLAKRFDHKTGSIFIVTDNGEWAQCIPFDFETWINQ